MPFERSASIIRPLVNEFGLGGDIVVLRRGHASFPLIVGLDRFVIAVHIFLRGYIPNSAMFITRKNGRGRG